MVIIEIRKNIDLLQWEKAKNQTLKLHFKNFIVVNLTKSRHKPFHSLGDERLSSTLFCPSIGQNLSAIEKNRLLINVLIILARLSLPSVKFMSCTSTMWEWVDVGAMQLTDSVITFRKYGSVWANAKTFQKEKEIIIRNISWLEFQKKNLRKYLSSKRHKSLCLSFSRLMDLACKIIERYWTYLLRITFIYTEKSSKSFLLKNINRCDMSRSKYRYHSHIQKAKNIFLIQTSFLAQYIYCRFDHLFYE